jgi:HEAT repeat protein
MKAECGSFLSAMLPRFVLFTSHDPQWDLRPPLPCSLRPFRVWRNLWAEAPVRYVDNSKLKLNFTFGGFMFQFGPPNIEKLKSRHDINGLIKALGYSKKKEVRNQASNVLKEIGEPAVDLLISALSHPNKLIVEEAEKTLEGIGVQAVDRLISILDNENHPIKLKAIEILGNIKDTRSVETLISKLNQWLSYSNWDTDQLSIYAAYSLGKTKDSRAIEPLISAMQSSVEILASAAARALGEFKDARAVETLLSALTSYEMKAAKAGAAEALGMIGDVRAVKPLISMLKGGSSFACSKAIEALGKIGDVRAVEPLCNLLQVFKPGISKIAEVLATFGDIRAIEPLDIQLKSENDQIEYYKKNIENYKKKYSNGDHQYLQNIKDETYYLETAINNRNIIKEAIFRIKHANLDDNVNNKRKKIDKLPRLIKECEHEWIMAPDKACHICGQRDEGGVPLGCKKCSLLICHKCLDLFN